MSMRLRDIAWIPATIALITAGCGGGSGGEGVILGSGGTGGTGAVAGVSIGVMTKGSVIVNGVRFDDSAAAIFGDNVSRSTAALQTGMVVQVKGKFNSDGTTGVAQTVLIRNEVRGTVQSIDTTANPPFITVLGQKVLAFDDTVYANFGAAANAAGRLAQLTANVSVVEVHGQRDAAGNIQASRIEVLAAGGVVDELRGTVSNLNAVASTFTLNGVNVSYQNATIIPSGASITSGAVVEVRGSLAAGTFNATAVQLEDPSLLPAQGEEFEVEGFVTGFTSPSNAFNVGGRAVRLASDVRFENGAASDLVNGAKVEAEGQLSGTTLVATKIQFRSPRTILTGIATVDTVARTASVLGKTVVINDLTEVRSSGGGSSLAALQGQRVEARCHVDAGGNIIAERIEDIGASGGGVDIVQALASAESEAARTLAMLGINANLAGSVQFLNDQDAPISSAQFFGLVTPDQTVVKVKGAFAGGTINATEAEIEN
jgi:hypothetical protein